MPDPVTTVAVLAFGTFWFWVLFVAFNIMLICAIEGRSSFWATASILITLGLIQYFGDIPIYRTLWNYWYFTIGGFGLYFVVGTLSMLINWALHCREQRRKLDERMVVFCEKYNLEYNAPMTPAQLTEWRKDYKMNGIEYKPKFRDHKTDIYFWVAYWPWTLTWRIINDPVKRILQAIYNRFAGIGQKISDNAFSGTQG